MILYAVTSITMVEEMENQDHENDSGAAANPSAAVDHEKEGGEEEGPLQGLALGPGSGP